MTGHGVDVVNDRVVLITGAGRRQGLGFAVGRRLAQEGHQVVLTSRDPSQSASLAGELRDEGLRADSLQLDLSDAGSVEACRDAVQDRYRRLDSLINNAAGGFDIEQSVLDADLAVVRVGLEVNFVGPWALIQAMLPLLEQSAAARIVNVSSAAASITSDGGLANPEIGGLIPGYSLSKTALNALTVKMAPGLRARNILINAVCPGETATHPETGDEQDARQPSESAKGVAWAATLPDDGPSGGFFRDGQPLSW